MKILNIYAIFFPFFLIFVFVLSINATTVRVPSDQPDIQSGINAAGNLDSVLVAPGTYRVNLDFKGKSITVLSEAGPLLTTLKPYTTDLPIVVFQSSESPLALLEGFTLRERYNKPAVQIYNSSPVIRANVFTNNDAYYGGGIIYVKGNSSCTIEKNLFYDNPNAYVVIWEDSDTPSKILNNTVDGGRDGILLWGSSTTAFGNTVINCSKGISAGLNSSTAYNNVWSNSADWPLSPAGSMDVSFDPLFANPDAGDYSLSENSPLIDIGHPEAVYYDPDGTRNDIGAIPFGQRAPLAINLRLENYEVTNVLNHFPTFIWKFYDPDPTQTAFEIEVGSDKDWATAELWTSGAITSPDTFATYNGAVLENGSVNYYRVRVNNGTAWGRWNESVFRINSIPSAPVLFSPINQDVTSMFGVHLSIANALDAEGDDLIYEFELYSDAGMVVLVESIEGIGEQNDITQTGKISNLEAVTEYWWRCRAFDGYEHSVWSELNSFVTRAPFVLNVPSSYITLQAGINAAEEGDTVLVAGGTYAGDGNRDLNFNGTNIILISEDGFETTIIDCGGEAEPHQGFIFVTDEDSTSVIDGFTITNSYSPMLWNEGAIICQSSPTIKNCLITENIGDGILCSYGGSPIIIDCIISNNSNVGIRNGWSDLTMRGCLVIGNGHDGFHLNYGAVNISNCTFAYNGGTGVFLEGDPPKIGQMAEESAIIKNCIMAFNEAGGVLQWFYISPPMRLECNNAFGNGDEDWSVHEYNVDDEYGNISADPLFCDVGNLDYTLANISPSAPDNNECNVLMGAREVGCVMTDINDNTTVSQKPENFTLEQNYPNPFNPSTLIQYSLPRRSNVKILVINVLGQNVITLVDATQSAGKFFVSWDGTDTNGKSVTSGVYLYKIITDEYILARKMILLK